MNTVTCGTSGRMQTTLQAAWNALPSSWTEDQEILCYNDSEFTAGLNPTGKTANGFKCYVRAAPGHSFRDHADKLTNPLGKYDQSKGVGIRVAFFGDYVFIASTAIILEGLQVKNSDSLGSAASVHAARNCLLDAQAASSAVACISAGEVTNCIIIQRAQNGRGVMGSSVQASGNTVICTHASGSNLAGINALFGPGTAKGNVVIGFNTSPFSATDGGSWHASTDYNATNHTSTGTGTGTNNLVSITPSDNFENLTYSTLDMRLKSGNVLVAEGVTISARGGVDILGQTLPGTPSIGAVEPISTGPTCSMAISTAAAVFAGSAAVSPAAAMAISTAAAVFAGSAASGTVCGMAITTEPAVFAGSASVAGVGTLTTGALKENSNSVWANETGATAWVWEVVSGNLVVKKTGQTTNSLGVMVISDVLIVAATEYRVRVKLASGAEAFGGAVAT